MKKKDGSKGSSKGKGPKYYINIEGTEYPWDDDVITTEQIIDLGGWDQSQGAIMIDLKTQEEQTLTPGQEIEVKPGMAFAKKIEFKRGHNASEVK